MVKECLNSEGGNLLLITKVFLRPDIDIDIEPQVFDDEVMNQEAMSNEY